MKDDPGYLHYHRPPGINGLLFSAVLAGACLACGIGVVIWGVLRAIGVCP